jgi:tRNA threonylcarbamoyladenosine modification (KEOPS) complex Cgi121 subunit
MRDTEINGKYMVLEGFKNIKVTDMQKLFILIKEQAKDCCIQLFDPGFIAGFDHLYFSALNALKAFETGRNISKDPAVEILLYASGQHQIRKAIQLLGIKPDLREVAVLILAETHEKALKALDKVSHVLQGDQCDEIVDMTEKKVPKIKSAFDIKDEEITATLRKSKEQAITSLLIERAALLATQT